MRERILDDRWPYPTSYEPKPKRLEPDDCLWPYGDGGEPLSAAASSRPSAETSVSDLPSGSVAHVHQLCGHECARADCLELRAVCPYCDYLRDCDDDRNYPGKSYGVDR